MCGGCKLLCSGPVWRAPMGSGELFVWRAWEVAWEKHTVNQIESRLTHTSACPSAVTCGKRSRWKVALLGLHKLPFPRWGLASTLCSPEMGSPQPFKWGDRLRTVTHSNAAVFITQRRKVLTYYSSEQFIITPKIPSFLGRETGDNERLFTKMLMCQVLYILVFQLQIRNQGLENVPKFPKLVSVMRARFKPGLAGSRVSLTFPGDREKRKEWFWHKCHEMPPNGVGFSRDSNYFGCQMQCISFGKCCIILKISFSLPLTA